MAPVRLNRDLTIAELQDILILHNARLMLTQAHDQGGYQGHPSWLSQYPVCAPGVR